MLQDEPAVTGAGTRGVRRHWERQNTGSPERAPDFACLLLQALADAAEGRRAAERRAEELAQRLAAADAVAAQLAAAIAAEAAGAELAAKARPARGGPRAAAARWTLRLRGGGRFVPAPARSGTDSGGAQGAGSLNWLCSCGEAAAVGYTSMRVCQAALAAAAEAQSIT